ncbi:MAG: hypothetical protein JOZ71_11565 [Ktedonobacteraceae bacterium]|nr:hypothetical protein [Ktedonobacteraceae bacterium]
MTHEVPSEQEWVENEATSGSAFSPSLFSPPDRGWQLVRLPELASNGFPFSPTFILPKSTKSVNSTVPTAEQILPFGFHYWQRHKILNRPAIDLTKGYYDPHSQTYTIPLRAGGDTDGGTIDTGYWTEKCGGDGEKPSKEWDITEDSVTD